MQRQGQSVATSVPVTKHDGTPATIQMKDRKTGQYSTSTFKTMQLNQTYGDFVTNLNLGVADGVKAVRNSGGLVQVIDKPVSAYPIGTPFTDGNIEAMEHILVSLLEQAPYFTAAETFATTVSAGAATYEDVANGGGLKNI
jgi:hypothetical protein